MKEGIMIMAKLKLGSLFAGIGGIDLGFKLAGVNPVWANEIDEFCAKTFIPSTVFLANLSSLETTKISSACNLLSKSLNKGRSNLVPVYCSSIIMAVGYLFLISFF